MSDITPDDFYRIDPDVFKDESFDQAVKKISHGFNCIFDRNRTDRCC